MSRLVSSKNQREGSEASSAGEPAVDDLSDPSRCSETGDCAVPPATRRRTLGILAGQAHISDDFNAPLPDEILDAFEGACRARIDS